MQGVELTYFVMASSRLYILVKTLTTNSILDEYGIADLTISFCKITTWYNIMGCKCILNLLHLQRHLFFIAKSCVDVKLSPLPTWVHRSSSPVLVTIFLFRWILSVSIAFHESSSGFGAKGWTRVSTLPTPLK